MPQLEAAGETVRYLTAGSGAKVILLNPRLRLGCAVLDHEPAGAGGGSHGLCARSARSRRLAGA